MIKVLMQTLVNNSTYTKFAKRLLTSDKIDLPSCPGKSECCSTGCYNCVWLEYANKLFDYYYLHSNSIIEDQTLKAKIDQIRTKLNEIDDTNMRAFLLTELDLKIEKLLQSHPNIK